MNKPTRLLLWNTKGLIENINTKFTNILSFARTNCDILLLTETHVTTQRLQEKIQPYLDTCTFISQHFWGTAHSTDDWAGTAIISFNHRLKITVKEKTHPKLMSLKGRFQLFQIQRETSPNSTPLSIALVYAPPHPAKRRLWLRYLPTLLPPDLDILAGDFNCILHKSDSTHIHRNSHCTSFAGANELEEVVNELSLEDAYLISNEQAHNDPRRFTFRDLSQTPHRLARLDRFYIHPRNSAVNCRVLPTPSKDTGERGHAVYDHLPLLLTTQKVSDKAHDGIAIGPGPFRAPNHWFDNQRFTTFLTTVLTNDPIFHQPSPQSGELLIHFLSKSCKRYKKAYEPIPPYITAQRIYESALRTPNFPMHQLEELKLDWIQSLELNSELERERMREEMDLSNDRVCQIMTRRLHKRKQQRTVCSIRDKQGNLQTKTPHILQAFEEFYADLYKERPHCSKSLTLLLSKWQIPQELKDSWESIRRPFTQEELDSALSTSIDAKAPGTTGLTYAPFKKIKSATSPHLLALYNAVWNATYPIPCHWKETLITTIHKGKGAPEDLISSRRPISLLNTDYKLFAKMIAKRLGQIAAKFTLPNQGGFVPGRNIQDNIVAILEAIHNASSCNLNDDDDDEDRELQPLLALLDFEKAFDRVSHQALQTILTHLGCPPTQTDIFLQICSGMTGRINVNGFLTKPIKLRAGVRQGCPISPILFILAIETLNRAIMADERCKGIGFALPINPRSKSQINKLWDKEAKNKPPPELIKREFRTGLLADDVSLGARNRSALQRQLYWVDIYCRATSAKLNKHKSELLDPHNSLENVPSLMGIPITRSTIQNNNQPSRYLGIWLNAHKGIAHKSTDITQNIQQDLNSYQRNAPQLTLHGKTMALNTYQLSKLWYISAFDPPTKDEIKSLETTALDYIWNNGVHRMSYKRLIAPRNKGGLNLTDVESKIRASQAALVVRFKTQQPPPFWERAWSLKILGNAPDQQLPRKLTFRAGAKPSNTMQRLLGAYNALPREALLEIANQNKPEITKTLYNALRDRKTGTLQNLLSPSMREMANDPKTQINWETLMERIWTLPVRPIHREIFWRTMQKCQNRDYSKKRPNCALCKRKSNTYHMFSDCPDAQIIWNTAICWLEQTFQLSSPTTPNQLRDSVFRWNLGSSQLEGTFIITVHAFIWKRWNAYLHGCPEKAPLQLLPHFLLQNLRIACSNALRSIRSAHPNSQSQNHQRKLAELTRDWNIGTVFEIHPVFGVRPCSNAQN